MSAAMAMVPEEDLPVPPPFKKLGELLFFYLHEFSRKTSIQVPLETGTVPMPHWQREQRQFVYAWVLTALHEREPEDYPFDPPITKDALNALAHWWNSDQPRASLAEAFADSLGVAATWAGYCKACRKIRNCLRRRMVARGLLE